MFGDLNLSLLESYDSGRAYSASAAINARTFPGAPSTAAYTAVPATATYYFRPRGSFRFDDATRTDLGVNWSKPVWHVNLFAQAEVINVFNEHALTGNALGGGVSTTVTVGNASFNPFTQTPRECPQSSTVAQCNAAFPVVAGDPNSGWNYKLSDAFGKATSFTGYQQARTYQFSLGLRF
jgi:hypothetical protein